VARRRHLAQRRGVNIDSTFAMALGSKSSELDTLVPAYAATIHKSQGSEYPAVVIPLMTQHYAMLQRNLFYTGVTRGKRLVVLVSQKKAVAIAVRNVSGRRRWSKLQGWLTCRSVT
jgi:exodeoxyribonuclease V alpha subunit